MIDFKKYNINNELKLLYNNPLAKQEDVDGFIMEGSAAVTFPQKRMRLENCLSAVEGQKANYVFWCPEEFPSDVYIEWEFWPVREPGLCMMFFAARGKGGEDLFSPNLSSRTGEYNLYHHGDINAFHISYYRRKEKDERAFHTCNLRKSYGFHLVAQGGDPLPDIADALPPYKVSILKHKDDIYFFIDDLEIFHYVDDGVTYGKKLGGGKIGFRQLAPFIGEYANLNVYGI